MRQPVNGWRHQDTALRQDAAYRSLIDQMLVGQPRQDLLVAAEAVRRTRLPDPLILEVGCGSGYYSEILSHLLGRQVQQSVALEESATLWLANRGKQVRPLLQCRGEPFRLNRLQQVVQCIYIECLDRVTIVSGGEDDARHPIELGQQINDRHAAAKR